MYLSGFCRYIICGQRNFSCTCFGFLGTSFLAIDTFRVPVLAFHSRSDTFLYLFWLSRYIILAIDSFHVPVLAFQVHHFWPSIVFMYLFWLSRYIILGIESFHVSILPLQIHHSRPSIVFMYLFCLYRYTILAHTYFSCTCCDNIHTAFFIPPLFQLIAFSEMLVTPP